MHRVMMNRICRIGSLSLVWLCACLGASSVLAQTSTEYRDWISVCAERAGAERCEIRQVLSIETEDGQAPLVVATVARLDDQLVLQLVLPLGLDLRPGVVMAVDDQPDRPAPVLTCLQNGCLSALALDAGFMAEMRAGRSLRLGFRPFNTDQTIVVELSLAGFTRASQTIK